MKHILTMKLSKRNKLLYFQNFISRTFLDSLSLEKKSRRQFIFLFTPVLVCQRVFPWWHAANPELYRTFPFLHFLGVRELSWNPESFTNLGRISLLRLLQRLANMFFFPGWHTILIHLQTFLSRLATTPGPPKKRNVKVYWKFERAKNTCDRCGKLLMLTDPY